MSVPSTRPTYCACTHKLRATAWNSQFARLIQELDELNIRSAQLRQIDKFIRFDTFICRSKESELNAAQALLTLWSKLISFTARWWQAHTAASPASLAVSHSPSPLLQAQSALPSFHPAVMTDSGITLSPGQSSLRMKDLRLVFELIDHIINRHEFDLIHLHPPPSSSASLYNTPSARMHRAHSMTVPRGDPRAAAMDHSGRERGASTDRGHALTKVSQHNYDASNSSTVPSPSSASFHSSRSAAHPSFLTVGEQLHLLQSYRQLLQHTVNVVLKMVRESSEGRSEVAALSSHSSTASFFSASTGSTCSNGEVHEAWEGIGPDAIREEDANELNDAMVVDDDQPADTSSSRIVRSPLMLSAHKLSPYHHEHSEKEDESAMLKGPEEGQKEAEKEADIERSKVEQMKPELTVAIPHPPAILAPLMPAAPLSPPTMSSPISPLSPATHPLDGNGSAVPSPLSSTRSLSSLGNCPSTLFPSNPSLLTRPDFVWFAGRLLAIVFFRLPVLSGTLLDSLSSDSLIAGKSDKTRKGSVSSAEVSGEWRDMLRDQVDEWVRLQQTNSSGMRKSPSISQLTVILSLSTPTTPSPPSTVTSDDCAEFGLTRSLTLPAALSATLPPILPPSSTLLSSSSAASNTSPAARARRALTSAFLQANPSFFEWTKPELNRDTYTERDEESSKVNGGNDDDSERGSNDVSANSDFDAGNDDDVLSTLNQRCIRLLLSHHAIFFVFAAAWMSHVHHTTNPIHPVISSLPPFKDAQRQEAQNVSTSTLYASDGCGSDGIMWDVIPGYRLLLHTVLKRLIAMPVQVEEEEEDEADIDPSEVAALVPLVDSDMLRRREEKKEEAIVLALRRESSTECQTYILKNSDSRAQCLAWLTEVLLRHTAVSDKRGVEKTLETLDNWYTLFLPADTQLKKLPISYDGAFSASSLPPHKLHHSLMQHPLPHNQRLPWLAVPHTPLFLAQMRERCQRARALARHTVNNPSMSHPFPTVYCTPLLISAISILLHQEHFQVLLKTLTFLYMHTGHFYGRHRQELFDVLLSDSLFPKLFLHWCTEIRRVFHCIIIYRVARDGRVSCVVPTVEEREKRTVSVMIDGKEELVLVVDAAPVTPASPATPSSSSPVSFHSSPTSALSPPAADSSLTSPPSSPSTPRRKLSSPNCVNEPRPSSHTVSSSPSSASQQVGWWGRISASLLSWVGDMSYAYDSPPGSVTTLPVSASIVGKESPERLGMGRSLSDNETEGRSRHLSHQRRISGGQQEEAQELLRSDDPALDTCCIVRTRLDKYEQDIDTALLAKLDRCLQAAHQQYNTHWQTAKTAVEGRVTDKPLLLPSLRSVSAMPPCSDVLVYHPHLHTYASSSFREYRTLMATFRRVQSQLNPSLAVSCKTSDASLLPADHSARAYSHHSSHSSAHNQRPHAYTNGHLTVNSRRGRGGTGAAMEDNGVHRSSSAIEQRTDTSMLHHYDDGYEGVVLVPTLYYTIPHSSSQG